MKKLKRAMAVLLTAAMVFTGLPGAPARAEGETGDPSSPQSVAENQAQEVQEAPEAVEVQETPLARSSQQPDMKLEQKSFENGILTMSLKLRPSEPGDFNDPNHPGTYISEGYLAFRVDMHSLIPIVGDDNTLVTCTDPDRMAFVGYTGGGNKTFLQAFLASNGEQVGVNGFGSNFGRLYDDARIYSAASGMICSYKREFEDGLADCYVQFRATDLWTLDQVDSDGYVTAMELRFLCYSGYDESGNPIPVENSKILFRRSILVPEAVGGDTGSLTNAEAQALVNQFNFTYQGTETPMAMGAAGFWEKEWDPNLDTGADDKGGYVDKRGYYYYGVAPQYTKWRDRSDESRPADITNLTGAPEMIYDNQDKPFVVTDFNGAILNTYYDKNNPGDPTSPNYVAPDFYPISSETDNKPRYSVPTTEEAKTIEENVSSKGGWVPKSYADDDANEKQVMLRYSLGTEVTESSLKQTPEKQDLDQFLRSLNWSFSFKDGTSLNDLQTTLIDDAEIRQVTDDGWTYTIREALISDPGHTYYNKKVQRVYRGTEPDYENDPYTVTPIGIMFAFHENTMVSYESNEQDKDGYIVKEEEGYAPQLRIDPIAADKDSYLWDTHDRTENNVVRIVASYVDASGATFPSHRMDVGVYEDTHHAADIKGDLLDKDLTVEDPETHEQVQGFYVPVGVDQDSDVLANEGVKMKFRVRDQYGFTALDENDVAIHPSITIVPSDEVKEKLKTGNVYQDSDCPFEVQDDVEEGYDPQPEADGSYPFVLHYSYMKGVNDVKPGVYTINLSYTAVVSGGTSVHVTRSIPLLILKEDDVFSFMNTDVSGVTTKLEDGVRTATLAVPDKTKPASFVTINITELANQWRDPVNTPPDLYKYDMYPGLRDTTLADRPMTLDKIKSSGKFAVSFTYQFLDADKNVLMDGEGHPLQTMKGVDVSNIDDGTFGFDYRTATGTIMEITVSVKDKGSLADPLTATYRFTLNRDESTLELIELTNTGIIVNPDNGQKTLLLEIPSQRDEQQKGPAKATITARARDQYGDVFQWDDVIAKYGSDWAVKTKTTLAGREGITQESEENTVHENVISVSHTADAVTTELWVQLGGKKSEEIVLAIQKPWSVADTVTLTYDQSTLYVPDNTQLSDVRKATPTVTVLDQFGDPMTEITETNPNGDYSTRWRFIQEPTDKEKVTLDTNTGVLSVAALAQNSPNIKVQVQIWQKLSLTDTEEHYVAGSAQEYVLNVQRLASQVTSIEVTSTKSINYPDSSDADSESTLQFTANGSTQYGEGQTLSTNEGLSWKLDEVTTVGGDTIKYQLIPGQDIYLDQASATYKMDSRLQMTTKGLLSLFKADHREEAPKTITVTATHGDATETVTVDVNLEESYPYTVNILTDADQAITMTVPSKEDSDAGRPAKRTMKAQIWDQYDFIMSVPASDIQWSIVGTPPTGISLTGDEITVDHTAEGCEFDVKATYEKNGKTVTATQKVGVNKNPGTPTTIEIVGLDSDTVPQGANVTVPLPGLNSDCITYGSSDLRMACKVYDEYGDEIRGTSVRWSIAQHDADTVAPTMATVVNDRTGSIRVQANSGWLAADTEDNIVDVTVHVASDPTVTATGTLNMKRQADTPLYAVPIRGDYVPSDREGDTQEITDRYKQMVLIPSKDYQEEHGKTYVEYTAEIYSQYGTLMRPEDHTSDPETLKANFGLSTGTLPVGLTESYNDATGIYRLEIASYMNTLSIEVRAYPAKNPTGYHKNKSYISTLLDRGAGYPAGIALGETAEANSNPSAGTMGLWVVPDGANVPPDRNQGETDQEYTFYARVVDQYGGDIGAQMGGATYPVWKLKENYPGVTFKPGTTLDSDGNATGASVTIVVSGEAMAAGVESLPISLDVWVVNQKDDGEDYLKTQTITLKKNPSAPAHIFFDDCTENGEAVTGMDRPTLEQKKTEKTITVSSYDQYGYKIDGNTIDLRFQRSYLQSMDADVEPIYETDPENPDVTGALIGYRAVKDGVPMAELIPSTGKLTVFSACDLPSIQLRATSSRIVGGDEKLLTVPIATANPTATYIDVARVMPEGEEDTHAIVLDAPKKDEETPPFALTIRAVIRDQFGEIYNGSAAVPVWTMTNADGTPYVEYTKNEDKEDVPKPASPEDAWFLTHEGGNERSDVLVVRPVNYQTEASVTVTCELWNRAQTASLGLSSSYSISIKQKKAASVLPGGSVGGTTALTVTYRPGDHGSLSGNTTETVVSGGHPISAPLVVADSGWGFAGWLGDDGELYKDPSTAVVNEDMTFTAQYTDIASTAFLSGYEDHTVRPANNVTRGEFIKMLMLVSGKYEAGKKYKVPFADVNPDRYYANYIGCAYSLGIAAGYKDGTFHPDSTITRAEAAKLIAITIDLELGSGETKFSDVNSKKWYAAYVGSLSDEGVINGYKDGTFAPAGTLTRAESVKMLVLIQENAPDQMELNRIRRVGKSPFLDTAQNSWYYPYVLRAAGVA